MATQARQPSASSLWSRTANAKQAVVGTELNARILSEEVQTLGLIKLAEVFYKVVQNRRVRIILGLEMFFLFIMVVRCSQRCADWWKSEE